jgi:hypothetical protein
MVEEKNSMVEYLSVLQAAKTMIFGSNSPVFSDHEDSENLVSDGSEGDGLVVQPRRRSIIQSDFGNDFRGLRLAYAAGTISSSD